MQFRIQGQRIQCIRSVYDTETKRCKQHLIVSFPKWSDKIPADDLTDLTSEEHEELKAWWANREAENKASSSRVYVRSSVSDMARIVRSISTEDGAGQLTEDLSSNLWEQITELQKALRKAGYPRPRATKKTSVPKEQGDLLG